MALSSPPPPGPSGHFGKDNPEGREPGRPRQGRVQEVFDLFGADTGIGIVMLVLLLLGLMHAAMTRAACTC